MAARVYVYASPAPLGAAEGSALPVAVHVTGHVSVLCVCVRLSMCLIRAQFRYWLNPQTG